MGATYSSTSSEAPRERRLQKSKNKKTSKKGVQVKHRKSTLPTQSATDLEFHVPHTHLVFTLADFHADQIAQGMGPFLSNLPQELLVDILRRVRLRDVLVISSTSRILHALCSDDIIWKQLFAAQNWYTSGTIDKQVLEAFLHAHPQPTSLALRAKIKAAEWSRFALSPTFDSERSDAAEAATDSTTGYDWSSYRFGQKTYRSVQKVDEELRNFHCCWKDCFVHRYSQGGETNSRTNAVVVELRHRVTRLQERRNRRLDVARQRRSDGIARIAEKENVLVILLRLVLGWLLWSNRWFPSFLFSCSAYLPNYVSGLLYESSWYVSPFLLVLWVVSAAASIGFLLASARAFVFVFAVRRVVTKANFFHRKKIEIAQRHTALVKSIHAEFDDAIDEAQETLNYYLEYRIRKVQDGRKPATTSGERGSGTCAIM